MGGIDLSFLTDGAGVIQSAILEFALTMGVIMVGFILISKFVRMPKWLFNITYPIVTAVAFIFLLFNNYIPSVAISLGFK